MNYRCPECGTELSWRESCRMSNSHPHYCRRCGVGLLRDKETQLWFRRAVVIFFASRILLWVPITYRNYFDIKFSETFGFVIDLLVGWGGLALALYCAVRAFPFTKVDVIKKSGAEIPTSEEDISAKSLWSRPIVYSQCPECGRAITWGERACFSEETPHPCPGCGVGLLKNKLAQKWGMLGLLLIILAEVPLGLLGLVKRHFHFAIDDAIEIPLALLLMGPLMAWGFWCFLKAARASQFIVAKKSG